VSTIASGIYKRIDFVPNRVILPEEYSYIYTTIEESLEDIVAKYETYYQDQPFVRLLPQEST
jgi:N-acetyl-gamma-glutamyl-phosphate reductase